MPKTKEQAKKSYSRWFVDPNNGAQYNLFMEVGIKICKFLFFQRNCLWEKYAIRKTEYEKQDHSYYVCVLV